MKLPEHVFREYDIRGVADRDLSDTFVVALANAFASKLDAELGRRPVIAVCRDGRVSSPRIHAALVAGLTEMGADVIDVGVGPTPLLYFAAHHLGTDGAIQITGSHNPGEDNGFKMMRGKASFFGADIAELKALVASALRGALKTALGSGSVAEKDVSQAYVDAVAERSRLSGDRPKLRVVVDAGNGAAGPLGIRTLSALGFEVDALHCDIDGTFPNHHPDPTVEENLIDLRERVLATNAHVGIAWDGDGDRIGALDEKGHVVWGDKLMIVFSRALLAEHPGATILGEVKCSQTLFDDIRARGGNALYSRTGHSLIKTKMKAEGALLAGEMSGHLFFADRWFGFDDAIYGTVRLLEILGAASGPFSALLDGVPETFVTPEIRVACPDEYKFDVVREVTETFRKTHALLDIDGARIDFGDGAWGLCRASNTQPVLVLRFEARTEERLAAIKSEVEAAVMTARASHSAIADGRS